VAEAEAEEVSEMSIEKEKMMKSRIKHSDFAAEDYRDRFGDHCCWLRSLAGGVGTEKKDAETASEVSKNSLNHAEKKPPTVLFRRRNRWISRQLKELWDRQRRIVCLEDPVGDRNRATAFAAKAKERVRSRWS